MDGMTGKTGTDTARGAAGAVTADAGAADIVADCTALRRRLHRDPELSNQEHRTRGIILAELEALKPAGFEVRAFPGSTAVAALWPGRDRFRSIAFRADMDALPLEETS